MILISYFIELKWITFAYVPSASEGCRLACCSKIPITGINAGVQLFQQQQNLALAVISSHMISCSLNRRVSKHQRLLSSALMGTQRGALLLMTSFAGCLPAYFSKRSHPIKSSFCPLATLCLAISSRYPWLTKCLRCFSSAVGLHPPKETRSVVSIKLLP